MKHMKNTISTTPGLLLIDDDSQITQTLALVLKKNFNVHIASSRADARRLLQTIPVIPYLALVDLGMPPNPNSAVEGFALVKELLCFNPAIKILILSGQDSEDNVQHALTLGAVDFIAKPCDPKLLKARLHHQVKIYQAEQHKPQVTKSKCGLIGESPAMATLHAQIRQFADSPFAVMIAGESGSGKELVAQCLHTQSRRHAMPCLTVNCAAFDAELLGAQLFGHAKGAFTGATSLRAGFFEDAGDGSLILDEIGEMPMDLQAKLLRVLENGEYYRLGETKVRQANARIIAATNRNLREAVANGTFRTDLYHRLSILTIKLPPLSERGEDKLQLLANFQEFYAEMDAIFNLDDAARKRWLEYEFPGNVRELRNIVIRLGAKYPNQTVNAIQLEGELESTIEIGQPEEDSDDAILQHLNQDGFSIDQLLLDLEGRYIDAALQTTRGNLSKAARLLGINRTTLYSKMRRSKGGPL